MNWKTLSCSLLLALPAAVRADVFHDANALYDAGKFADAVAAYERIEPKTAHTFFNLGNAWFRQEQFGRAILNYERARRLAPRDPDIRANLKFAQQRAGVETGRGLGETMIQSRTMREWCRYELSALWLTVLAVAGFVWLPRLRKMCGVVAVAAFLGWAATVTALAARWTEPPRTVVLTAHAETRFAPLAEATVHFLALEGATVLVREDRGAWLFVERADGRQGWIARSAVEKI